MHVAAWRQFGSSRIAVFSIIDSYAIALAGQPDFFAQSWSETLSKISRPADRPRLIDGMF